MGRVESARNHAMAPENSCYTVFACENSVLEPMSEYVIECFLNCFTNNPDFPTFVFLPYNDKLAKKHVLAATSIVKPVNGLIPVRLINLSEDNIKIDKNTKIGDLEPAKEMEMSGKTNGLRILKQENSCQDISHIKDILEKVKLNSNLSHDQIKRVSDLISDYSSLFSRNKMDIGLCKTIEHEIYLCDCKPIHVPYRRVPLGLEQKVDDMVDDLLNKDIIRHSVSAWNSPIVLVKKKNGDMRMCIDFRALNSVTRKVRYPIPETKHLLDCLAGSSYFSSLDLSSAYYQCEITEKHKEYTAFSTRRGHFEFNRMPFGLTGAPFTFQRMMHLILNAENWEQCVIYLDDVLVFARSFEEHLSRLRVIFDKLYTSGIKLSPSKCDLFQSQLVFLGHVISNEGISADPSKIDSIKKWNKPSTIEEMKSFLGFANYYRRFIKSYAEYAAPLENMIKFSSQGNQNMLKKVQLVWSYHSEKCFKDLKLALISAPVLGYPSHSGEYILDCDASHDCMGAVLSQLQHGREVVISYSSKKMSKSELSYCITRKELLAVYTFTKQFKHYLLGRHFRIRTDHEALTWLLNWERPNTSQYCSWIAELEIYDFKIEHRSGSKHQNADFLSRLESCEQCGIQHVEPKRRKNVKILAESTDERRIRIVNNASTITQEEKTDLLRMHHDAMGHIGFTKTLNLVKEHYDWCGITDDVRRYVANCVVCAERKGAGNISKLEMQHIAAVKPFQKVMIDICGPITKSKMVISI